MIFFLIADRHITYIGIQENREEIYNQDIYDDLHLKIPFGLYDYYTHVSVVMVEKVFVFH